MKKNADQYVDKIVSITQYDIDNSEQCHNLKCAMTMALNRHFGDDFSRISVNGSHVYFGNSYDANDFDFYAGLSLRLRAWIRAFDEHKSRVEPISFKIKRFSDVYALEEIK